MSNALWRQRSILFSQDSCTLNTSLISTASDSDEGSAATLECLDPSEMQMESTLFRGVIAGPTVDRRLSLHLCKLHRNPLSSKNVEGRWGGGATDTEQPAVHAARETDAIVFTEKWEGGEGSWAPPGRQGQRRADIQRGEWTPRPGSDVCSSAWCSPPDKERTERVCVSSQLNCLSLRQTDIMSPFTFIVFLTLTVDCVSCFGVRTCSFT